MKFIFSPNHLVFFFLSCGMAWAQESGVFSNIPTPFSSPTPFYSATPNPTPLYQMEEIVVQADKEKGETWEGRDLDSLKNNGRLSNFLNNAGGLETQGMGGAKTFSNATLRGSSPEQTLILLNGQRTNQGFDLGLIPTGDIERIEVLKGPAALAYGSDAMGGAINVITKPGEGGASLGASGGDFNTWQVQGNSGHWKVGSWIGSLTGSWYQTGGYTVNTDEVSGELNQDSQWTLGEDQLSLRAGYVYKNGGAPNGNSLSAQDTGQFDTDDREKRNAVDASLEGERHAGDWIFRPSLSYSFADVSRLNPLGPDNVAGVPIGDKNIYNNFGLKARGLAKWTGLLQSFESALEVRAQNVQGTEGLGDGLRWNNTGSLSAQGLLGFTPNLSLDLGGRLDWYETYGVVVFNPEGTLKYLLGKGQDLYFEAGTGYRYPDFDELYHPTITYLITSDIPVEFGQGETGNPGLKPETSVNLEAGTELLLGNLLLKLSGFMNSFSNLIVPAENSSNYWTFLNVARALQAGWEINLRWEFLRGISLNGDYTYVDSRDTDSGRLIPTRLRQKLSGELTWTPAPGVQLSLDGRYVDRNPAVYNGPQDSPPIVIASAYTVFDAGFKLEVAKETRFFVTLDNLFNQTYATFQGLPMPGRDLEMGTNISF